MNHPGPGTSYTTLHRRVRKLRGTPSRCEACNSTDPAKRFEWANLSGNYADPWDYARLCRLCHWYFDAARRQNAFGRPFHDTISGPRLIRQLAEKYGIPIAVLMQPASAAVAS